MHDAGSNDNAVLAQSMDVDDNDVVEMCFGSQMKMSLASEFMSTTLQHSDGRAAVYLTEWNFGAFLTHSRRLSMTSKECDACGTLCACSTV